MLAVLKLLLLVTVVHSAIVLRNPNDARLELVVRFTKTVSEKYPECIFLLAHDFHVLPSSITSLLTPDRSRIVTQATNRSEPLPKQGLEYWFSWMHRPTAVSHPGCILYAFFFMPDNFLNLMEHMAAQTSMQTSVDRYLFWNRRDQDIGYLHSNQAENLLFKIGLSVDNNSSQIHLHTVCFFCDRGSPQTVTLDPDSPDLYPDFTRNFNGKHVHGVFFYKSTPEWVRQKQEEYDTSLFFPDAIFKDLSEKLNFDYTVDLFTMAEGASHETKASDGLWYGGAGDVLYGRADMSHTIVNSDALEVIDYAFVLNQAMLTLVTRKPYPMYPWYSVFQPYTSGMWILIFLSCCLGTLFFWAIIVFPRRYHNPFYPARPPTHNFGYSLRSMFISLIEENPNLMPTSHTSRVFLAFWYIFAEVIICGYDTKLISFLMRPELEVLPTTFEEMVFWKPEWQWGMYRFHVPYMAAMLTGIDKEYSPILQEKLESVGMAECVERAGRESRFGCVLTTSILLPSTYSTIDLYNQYATVLTGEAVGRFYAGTVLPKHSVLRPHLKRFTTWQVDAGFQQLYVDNYDYAFLLVGRRTARATGRIYEVDMDLKIQQMVGPLMLLGAGLAISACQFTAERAHHRRAKGRKIHVHEDVDGPK